jgi:hypothetical protein
LSRNHILPKSGSGRLLEKFGRATSKLGSLSAYSNDVLASVFSKDPKFFSSLPRIEKNVFLESETG